MTVKKIFFVLVFIGLPIHVYGMDDKTNPIATMDIYDKDYNHDSGDFFDALSDDDIDIWSAAYSGNIDAVRFLLEHNVNADSREDYFLGDNRTALHFAAMSGSCEIINLLLDYRAKINIKDDQKKTPLYYAISEHQEKAAALLISKGASI